MIDRRIMFAVAIGIATAHSAHAGGLFTALGGRAGTAAIAAGTIERAARDPRIGAIFDDVNLAHVESQLGIQLCQIAGGPCVYKGLSMRATHAGYGIRQADFNALVEDMEHVMRARGIPWQAQSRLLARLAPMEPEVVTK